MIRTPTSSVTAVTTAARAFAWEIPGGALLSNVWLEDLPLSPLLR